MAVETRLTSCIGVAEFTGAGTACEPDSDAADEPATIPRVCRYRPECRSRIGHDEFSPGLGQSRRCCRRGQHAEDVACPDACTFELTLDQWTLSALDQEALGLQHQLRAFPP